MISFENMGVVPEILEAITHLGFTEPMPVQEKVIPLLLDKTTDMVVLAQTGTGKTAAFGIPIVQLTDPSVNKPQTVILAPTRELCLQITNDLMSFARYLRKVKILAVYGGSSIKTQIQELNKGVQIVVATPGRLIDLMERKAVHLSQVSILVLDEADEMLNMGFLDSINKILAGIPKDRQTLLFSATMPPDIAAIAARYMKNPAEITIGTRNAVAENLQHQYYMVNSRDKYPVLKRIADSEPDLYGIIFCRTRRETQEIATRLINDGYSADALHGDLSQQQRDTVMQKFRVKNIQLLVATDVAARGLDVTDLTHIIHYHLPDDAEVYTHRSGRTGRAGKSGISILLVQQKDQPMLRNIERRLHKPIRQAELPTGKTIFEKRLSRWVEKIKNAKSNKRLSSEWFSEVLSMFDGLSREELIFRLVSLEFQDIQAIYPEEPAPTIKHPNTHNRNYQDLTDSSEDFARLFINAGKMDGFNPSDLISIVNRNTRGKKIPLGRIDVKKRFSFFEVENSKAPEVIHMLNDLPFQHRKLLVKIAEKQ